MLKEQVAEELSKHVGMKKDEILRLLEKPKYSNLGDIAFPCFDLAKAQKKNPSAIAVRLAQELTIPQKV